MATKPQGQASSIPCFSQRSTRDTLFFLEVDSFIRSIPWHFLSDQFAIPYFFRGRFFYQINTLVFLIRSVCDTLLFLEVDSFIRLIPCFFLSDQFVIPYFFEVNSFVRSITLVFLNRSYINIPFLQRSILLSDQIISQYAIYSIVVTCNAKWINFAGFFKF